jgi:thiamine-monophosphate kinase
LIFLCRTPCPLWLVGFLAVDSRLKLPLLPERKLIQRIRKLASNAAQGRPVLGIGDDSAILQIPKGRQLLVTTDMCVEDVHFRRQWRPAGSVGHLCLARGLSDIAAMGGEPLACFLSLGLPSKLPQAWVDGFVGGLLRLAKRSRVPLAGGDTSGAPKITADILVLGTVPSGTALQRSGARPGDKVYVTGELGGPASILKRLYAGERLSAAMAARHCYPEPRLKTGLWLRNRRVATAMIDLSDGLSVDLAHICEESRVSALIDAQAIPLAQGTTLDLALHGGEDYELLFTASSKIKVPREIAGVRVTEVGEIQRKAAGSPVRIRDRAGHVTALNPAGWQHFSKI